MKFGIKRPDGELVSFHSGNPNAFETHDAVAAWLMRSEVVTKVEIAASSNAVIEGGMAEPAQICTPGEPSMAYALSFPSANRLAIKKPAPPSRSPVKSLEPV